MNFRLHQTRLSPEANLATGKSFRAAAWKACATVSAALCLLFAAFGGSAKDPFFTDFPVYQYHPLTNLAPSDVSAKILPETGATHTPSQAGTNSAVPISTNDMDALDNTYRLAIGDRISFRIEEDEDDPKGLTVTDSGDLEVPYIGRYPAAGKTCKELAQALKVELEKEYYYRATVIVAVDSMTKSRGKVYLVGAVRMPGPQDIPSDDVLTVSKAVLRAGGFTDYADKRDVKITRKGSTPDAPDQTLTVNVGDVLEKGKIGADQTLQAGDLIFIPERLVHF